MGRSQVRYNQTHPHKQQHKSHREGEGNKIGVFTDSIPDQQVVKPRVKVRKDLVQEEALQVCMCVCLFVVVCFEF